MNPIWTWFWVKFDHQGQKSGRVHLDMQSRYRLDNLCENNNLYFGSIPGRRSTCCRGWEAEAIRRITNEKWKQRSKQSNGPVFVSCPSNQIGRPCPIGISVLFLDLKSRDWTLRHSRFQSLLDPEFSYSWIERSMVTWRLQNSKNLKDWQSCGGGQWSHNRKSTKLTLFVVQHAKVTLIFTTIPTLLF